LIIAVYPTASIIVRTTATVATVATVIGLEFACLLIQIDNAKPM